MVGFVRKSIFLYFPSISIYTLYLLYDIMFVRIRQILVHFNKHKLKTRFDDQEKTVEKQDSPNILQFASAKFYGIADDYARFIEKRQLLDETLWRKFVRVFSECSDIQDDGWRCEYWGKMMRGACMTYSYTHNETLYRTLTQTVQELLAAQDIKGRLSGYDTEHEFRGWDMWGRKYILVGLEYYYEICRDKALKEKVLSAMCRHLDYILGHVGNAEGQLSITDTSEWWGGVNSCSILEPVIQLYKLTGNEPYRDFAEYIILTGGCKAGSLIDAVREGKKPSDFPVMKAYEIMSFFEGVLAYYEISGQKEYLELVKQFAETVYANEITVIGCAGCTHELFDGAAEKQTEYSETIMQETCVTVTWMRLLARLWENAFSAEYMDRIEQSARNALYGSINTQWKEGYSFEKKARMAPLPFDSYSPLYNNVRGRGIGGFKEFPEGGFYGCCACIGAAGTALYPLYAIVKRGDLFFVNFLLDGDAADKTPEGQDIYIACKTDRFASAAAKITVKIAQPERFSLAVRIPSWCKDAEISCGESKAEMRGGYAVFERVWKDGDEVMLHFPAELTQVHKNGKVAFAYGPFVLARDEAKEAGDITQIDASLLQAGGLRYTIEKAENGEQMRISLHYNGKKILLTDYASCGKDWISERNRVTVWMQERG